MKEIMIRTPKIIGFALLWSLLYFLQAADDKCQKVSICVGSECQSQSLTGVNRTVDSLSEITKLEKNCKKVEVYLTSRVHYLATDFTFNNNVEEIFIQGISTSSGRATIACRNASGINFSNNNSTVVISNIYFRACEKVRNVTWKHTFNISVTLYFKNSSFRLDKVEVANTSGIGLYAFNCKKHTIKHCVFHNNSLGNVKIIFRNQHRNFDTFVSMLNSTISDGADTFTEFGGGGLQVRLLSYILFSLSIVDSIFQNNKGQNGSHLLVEAGRNFTSVDVNITNTTFNQAKGCKTSGTTFKSLVEQSDRIKITIENSKFTASSCGALAAIEISHLSVINSLFCNNKGIGVYTTIPISNEIFNTTFCNNSVALYLVTHQDVEVYISHSLFINNVALTNEHSAAIEVEYRDQDVFTGNVVLEESSFKNNFGSDGNCSTLHFSGLLNVTLRDINVLDNNCSGIALTSSTVKIENTVNVSNNSALVGGGIRMEYGMKESSIKKFSRLILGRTATLKIIGNSAKRYGGGIFTDENCENRNNNMCPIQLMEVEQNFKQIQFAGNKATIGGDSISQGCFSDCSIENYFISSIDYCNVNQLFWSIISAEVEDMPTSTFAEYPKKVVFCDNIVVSCKRNYINCSREHQKEAYPGQIFEVKLMVADDHCIPSVGVIEATARQDGNNTIYIGYSNATEILRKSKKHCSPYQFTTIGKAPGNLAVIQLSFQRESKFSSPPAILNVTLLECPLGFKYVEEQGQCGCLDVLKSVNVECISANHSLNVPRHTWIGDFEGSIVVNQYCQHCNRAIYTIHSNSDILCKEGRSGALCSSCAVNDSLLLGGNKCGKCKTNVYKGILLLLSYALTGILLVIILLTLNITVSTGTINALIFYSNIVYSCHEIFLPVNTNSSGSSYDTMLQHLVNFLSAFQAWVNLNFGISTCFFNGYNTYVSVWMQFLFPLYIWLLILLIVLASRYSRRISRLTTSNTVPVLATLLLLSYSKLLVTSITAISFTNLHSLNGSLNYTVWLSDGNILYLHGKHIPIFIVSIIWILGFIMPFTLLILIGPMLQAKSNYRTLNWINKLKPLMDAFYGPYTDTYRYWPGILLMARLILFFTFALYSLGDTLYKLAIIAVMMTVLLIVWICLSKTHSMLPYQRKSLNYLELLFNLNLSIFTISSGYLEKMEHNLSHQQILASIMVGTVFLVFCCIIGYHLLQTTLKFKRCIDSIRTQRLSNDDTNSMHNDSEEACSNSCTHSTVKMQDFNTSSTQLREPLLAD